MEAEEGRTGMLLAALLVASATAAGQSSWRVGSSETGDGVAEAMYAAVQPPSRDNLSAGGKLPSYRPGGTGELSISVLAPGGSRYRLVGDGRGAGGVKPLTNDDVIELAKGGIGEENLLATIREAKAVKFDLTAQGELNLLRHNITSKVISAMRERAQEVPEVSKPKFGSGVTELLEPPARYWVVQGLMLTSFIVGIETTQGCINGGSCTAIPSPLRTRGAMYAVGLPITAGVACASYLMKKHQNRWWYVPSLAIAVGGAVLTVHSVRVPQ